MITEFIDKQDSFEIVRNQIAAILATETISQQQLAIDNAKDPNDWKLRVFLERSNPWEEFIEKPVDTSPIVNVWYDNSSFEKSSSNVMERQQCQGRFNIDCYGFGLSEDNPAGGHFAGDKQAALETHKTLRLVRNILMSSTYTYLDLRGLVWGRFPQSISSFQPQMDANQIQNIVGARLVLNVTFNEFAPQYEGAELELISIDVKQQSNGEVVAEADYDYTAP